MTSHVWATEQLAVVIADTSPLNYLVAIGEVRILPALFGSVVVPEMVRNELQLPGSLPRVRSWIADPPPWLTVEADAGLEDAGLGHLDDGERETLLLARSLCARLILMDERAGVIAARSRGFAVTGTIGLLDLAARQGILTFADAVVKLRRTSFRARPSLFEDLLARHGVL